MEVMRRWLKARGFALQIKDSVADCVIFDSAAGHVVQINKRLSYPVKVATLMHECGHVSIFMSRTRNQSLRIAGANFREFFLEVGRMSLRGRASRLCVLEEEIAAWQRGEDLAKRLGVRFSRGAFERTRTLCLMTYVKWSGDRMRAPTKTLKRSRASLKNKKSARARRPLLPLPTAAQRSSVRSRRVCSN